jgi:hypothetical protein
MTELNADPFHPGVRFGALGLWLLLVVLIFLGVRLAVTALFGPPQGVWVFVLALASIFASQPLAYLGEKKLVTLWPSGRAVQLESGAVTLREKLGPVRITLPPQGKVNFWRWQFQVRGRAGGRVPSGHHCCAVRLMQGEASLAAYAFLSPQQSEALAARYPFFLLRSPSRQQPLSGRDTVYLAAERARWEGGAELTPADFDTLLAHLAARVPEFASMTAA